MKLLIATSNGGKLVEIGHELAVAGLLDKLELGTLKDLAPGVPEVVEDRPSFIGNASKKARHYARCGGMLTLADDSGLCVAALEGGPGVKSARYAGEPCDNAANNAKLLGEMALVPDGKRHAKFVCAMALALPHADVAVVCDEVHGIILHEARGQNGFGYDPLFLIPSLGKTTAELATDEKSQLSHRGKALRHMIEWMKGHWSALEAGACV